jgi:hypothetical protein
MQIVSFPGEGRNVCAVFAELKRQKRAPGSRNKSVPAMESDKFKQLSIAGYGCVMVLEERDLN